MKTILLQINNIKAYKLIEDLELLGIVRILEKNNQPKEKLSAKYAGSLRLTDEEYNNIQDFLKR